MDTITSRFFDVLKELGISITSLAAEIPNITTKQKLSNAKNGRNEVQIDVVSYICSTYPIVSCDYILTGNGPMFKEEQETGYKQEVVSDHSKKLFEEFNKQTRILLAQRDEEIRELQLENALLKAQNNMQNAG